MAWTPRNIKDMVVQYPNRFKINGVQSTIEPDFGVVTEPGTAVNKALLQAYEDYLKFMATRWELLIEYNTAGTFTFNPATYGLTADDEIGVYMIGGGASGCAITANVSTGGGALISGGSSGVAKAFIANAPLTSQNGVIGAGGASVSTTGYADVGNSGGTTSFMGETTEGGKFISNYKQYCRGGQAADAIRGSSPTAQVDTVEKARDDAGSAPYGGATPIAIVIPFSSFPSASLPASSLSPGLALCPFDSDPKKIYLGAGGGAGIGNKSGEGDVFFSQATTERSVGKAGAGQAATTNATGENATAPGDGGGGAICKSGTATAGAGAAGIVAIYKRRRT